MKKSFWVVGLTLLATVQQLLAINVNLQQGSYSYGVGGEFVAADGNPSVAPGRGVYSLYGANYSSLTRYVGNNGYMGFGTFCVEYNEEFYPGNTYQVTHIGPNAMYGGQPPNGDPISKGTAMLYYLYATGNQSFGYDWGSGRQQSAGALQQAIWWLESEGPGGPIQYDANIFMKLAVDTFGTAAAAMADNKGLYGVSVMTSGQPGSAQDQLVLTVPDTSVTVLMLGLGILPILILRKRFEQSRCPELRA
jgi:hypothetical protein